LQGRQTTPSPDQPSSTPRGGLANNIKRLREEKGLLQKEVAAEMGLGVSNYSKIENGQREASVELLDKLSKFYGITIDVHMGEEVPTEITLEDKTASEQVRLIAELDEKDKSVIFGLIETMLTKKKFKDFFQKNVAAL
jgi:transcriptional regulator with XRE-family HTH domain